MKQQRFSFTLAEGATHVAMLPIFSKAGFTLAEVLITLGIIGVIAAITIPDLLMNYKAHRLRSQFLKSYSVIQQVFRQMEADEVSLDPKDYPMEEYYKVFGKYITGATDCGGQNQYKNPNAFNKPCYNHTKEEFTTLHGQPTASLNSWVNDGSWLMKDGSLLMFENGGDRYGSFVFVTVDLNGYGNPPDRLGYDVFTFQLIDENLKTMGDKGTYWEDTNIYCDPKSTNLRNGVACAFKAKNETDYFKRIVRKYK